MQRMGAAPPEYLALKAVNIYVRDLERSIHFYRDQLGFSLAFDAELPSGDRWVAVSPPDGAAVLSLHPAAPGTPEYNLIGRSTQIIFVTDDVMARVREWRSRGVRFRNVPRLRRVRYTDTGSAPSPELEPVWGGVFTRFQDPDGNTFQLVSFDNVSRAVEAQRRAAAEKLEAERRAAQELEIARQVQARLFPQTAPALRSLEYAGVCSQARQVGGDYYDFLDLGAQRLGLVVGDISGKGIAAALLMANLQANLRGQYALADDPVRFLECVNRLFFANTPDSAYATLFFADYDDESKQLRYANCGHLPALLMHEDGSIERLCSTATVLGLFAEWECEAGECRLRRGDLLALYTDGITEAENEQAEQFGEARLAEALGARRHLPPGDLVSSVTEEVRRFSPKEQQDDITLIVARCRECE